MSNIILSQKIVVSIVIIIIIIHIYIAPLELMFLPEIALVALKLTTL